MHFASIIAREYGTSADWEPPYSNTVSFLYLIFILPLQFHLSIPFKYWILHQSPRGFYHIQFSPHSFIIALVYNSAKLSGCAAMGVSCRKKKSKQKSIHINLTTVNAENTISRTSQ